VKSEDTNFSSSSIDAVQDDEILFRSVPNKYVTNGYLSSMAFSDRSGEYSVDRAKLNGNDPRKTQKMLTDYVFSVLTGDVRKIELISKPDGALAITHTVDVLPDPEKDNPAHAIIKAQPQPGSAREKKLREALARIALSALLPG
jgi:hypothetical protein